MLAIQKVDLNSPVLTKIIIVVYLFVEPDYCEALTSRHITKECRK